MRAYIGVWLRSMRRSKLEIHIAILRALREISGPEAAFSGLGGPIFFKGDGSSQKPFFVAAVHNGKLTPARPPTVSFPDSPAKVK